MTRLSATFREPAVMSVRYRILSGLADPLRWAAARILTHCEATGMPAARHRRQEPCQRLGRPS